MLQEPVRIHRTRSLQEPVHIHSSLLHVLEVYKNQSAYIVHRLSRGNKMEDPNKKHMLNQTLTCYAEMRPSHHRMVHSEMNFRLPEDLDLASDPFDAPAGSFKEMGSEDDLFCSYMDIEKLGDGGSGIRDSIFENASGGAAAAEIRTRSVLLLF